MYKGLKALSQKSVTYVRRTYTRTDVRHRTSLSDIQITSENTKKNTRENTLENTRENAREKARESRTAVCYLTWDPVSSLRVTNAFKKSAVEI